MRPEAGLDVGLARASRRTHAAVRVAGGPSEPRPQTGFSGAPLGCPGATDPQNPEVIPRLQKCGALVIPAINTFRYSRDNHLEEAARDIQHLLRMKVDGFQIDSVYQDQFGLPKIGGK